MLAVLAGALAPRASCMTASLGEEPASLCDLRPAGAAFWLGGHRSRNRDLFFLETIIVWPCRLIT